MFHHALNTVRQWVRSADQRNSLLASLIVHGTLLSMLSFLVFHSHDEPLIAAIDSTIVDATAQDMVLDSAVPMIVSVDEQQQDPSDSGGALMLAQVSAKPLETVLTDELARPLDLSPYGQLPAGGLALEVGASRMASSGGPGEGSGAGTANGSGNGFFGLKHKANKTVFVVDASTSMRLPHPGLAPNRFQRVQIELIDTIANMAETQEFFVIFFNNNAWPMPADRLVAATEDAKEKYIQWVAEAEAGGGTQPGEALIMAMHLKPDVIYFLTDGNFDYNVVTGTAAANQGVAIIHTICFGDDQGGMLLQAIARQNRGRYRFVSGDESRELPDSFRKYVLKQ